MSIADVVRQLEAFAAGQPIPRGDTLHFPLTEPDDTLFLAFVKMGGESSPWGVAYKKASDRKPTYLTVPEPRNRDDVAKMMAKLAPALLEHVGHPEHDPEYIEDDEERPLRQLWLPNGSHLDMLHFLAYAFSFAKKGPPERVALLRALGRAAGWLFREYQRPGQLRVRVATRALRESFSFPAENIRLEHLGFQMALLGAKGDLSARFDAARKAELEPVATSLAPDFERDELLPPLDRHNEARKNKNRIERTSARRAIRALLVKKLRSRIRLVENAVEVLSDDPRPVNPGTAPLEDLSHDEHKWQYLYMERRVAGGKSPAPSAETDRAAARAAARYNAHIRSDEIRARALVHFDEQMQADAVLAGDALAGEIIEVRDEGMGRTKLPVWVIEDAGDQPLRFREGSSVCVAGLPKRHGVLRSIALDKKRRITEVVIQGLKTVPRDKDGAVLPATSPALVGQSVILLANSSDWFAKNKSIRVWKSDGPGAWLTHGRVGA